MESLSYFLRFHRPPSVGGKDQSAIASSVRTETHIGSEGVTATIGPMAGLSASMQNGFALNHDQTMFFEWGSISFGETLGELQFESIGAGYVLGNLDPSQQFNLGVVMWRVTGGSGFFAGATGAITSNFLIDLQSGELVDNQIHMIYLP
jgi:hypothetical protein